MKALLPSTRGYFAIGVEGISKAVNLGNLLRSAHAFGASFVFTIGADANALEMRSDTSKAATHVPLYHWRTLAELKLPRGCSLVGVEILDEAADLPSFPHPLRAAYVLGPERGALTAELAARCQHLVRIPTAFSLNVATAGAIVMYDRLRSLGRFGSRPVAEGTARRPRRASRPGRAPQAAAAGLTWHPGQGIIEFCMLHICSRIGDGEMHRAVRATCLVISALCVTPALAQDATLLDKYKDWSAYAANGTPKVCFAVAKPKELKPKKGHQARPHLFLHLALAGR